jgi:preprotein translocase subunit Sec63
MPSLDALYRTLGLPPGASPTAVKGAYRKLAKVWHPDRFAANTEQQDKAMEQFKEINQAYAKLRSGQSTWQEHPTRVRPRSGMWHRKQAIPTILRTLYAFNLDGVLSIGVRTYLDGYKV